MSCPLNFGRVLATPLLAVLSQTPYAWLSELLQVRFLCVLCIVCVLEVGVGRRSTTATMMNQPEPSKHRPADTKKTPNPQSPP